MNTLQLRRLQKLQVPSCCNELYMDVSEVGFRQSRRVCSDCEVRTQPKLVQTCVAFQGTLACYALWLFSYVWQGYEELICFQCHFLMYPFPWHCFNAPLLWWHLFFRLHLFSLWCFFSRNLNNGWSCKMSAFMCAYWFTCAERQDMKIFG